MSTSSFPAAACRRTDPAGSPASPASSCARARALAPLRRLFIEKLTALHEAGRLTFLGDLATLANRSAFDTALAIAQSRVGRLRQAPLRRPRGGARLSRPLHPPRRHLKQPAHRPQRQRHLPLEGLSRRRQRQCQDRDDDPPVDEFIRRFLLPSCPTASTASATTACSLAVCGAPSPSCAPCSPYRTAEARSDQGDAADEEPPTAAPRCPCCGGP